MSQPPSLINIGELAKPATVLIEKISGAVGAVFEPHQVRRIARANADAAVIEAEGQIRVSELQKRAMIRFVEEEGRKQENIEAITSMALPHLEEDAQPQDVQDDWIANFFDKCRLISDTEMQQLWGRILAEEANSPGKCSRRTVNALASLDRLDAAVFTDLCRFGWSMPEFKPLVYDVDETIYRDADLSFTALAHLDAIGLIRYESLAGFSRKGFEKQGAVQYHDTTILLEFSEDSENRLDIGHVLLTRIGFELAAVVEPERDDEFLQFVLKRWAKEGLRPASPIEQEQRGDKVES